jgi:hypothetical protein
MSCENNIVLKIFMIQEENKLGDINGEMKGEQYTLIQLIVMGGCYKNSYSY